MIVLVTLVSCAYIKRGDGGIKGRAFKMYKYLENQFFLGKEQVRSRIKEECGVNY